MARLDTVLSGNLRDRKPLVADLVDYEAEARPTRTAPRGYPRSGTGHAVADAGGNLVSTRQDGLRQRWDAGCCRAGFRGPVLRPVGALVEVTPRGGVARRGCGALMMPCGVAIRGDWACVTTHVLVPGGGHVVKIGL